MNHGLTCTALFILCLGGCGGSQTSEEYSSDTSSSSSSSSSSSGDMYSSSSSSGGPIRPDEKELAAVQLQRDLWESYGVLEYKVTFQAQDSLMFPVHVSLHVNEGELVGVQQLDPEGDESLDLESYYGYRTIAEAFDTIESTASNGVYQLNVRYDPTHGFPTDFFMDYRIDYFDDQQSWGFSDLEILR